MWQTVAAGIIVAAALFFAVRRLIRTLRRKDGCGSGCSGCPLKDSKGCRRPTGRPDAEG